MQLEPCGRGTLLQGYSASMYALFGTLIRLSAAKFSVVGFGEAAAYVTKGALLRLVISRVASARPARCPCRAAVQPHNANVQQACFTVPQLSADFCLQATPSDTLPAACCGETLTAPPLFIRTL